MLQRILWETKRVGKSHPSAEQPLNTQDMAGEGPPAVEGAAHRETRKRQDPNFLIMQGRGVEKTICRGPTSVGPN